MSSIALRTNKNTNHMHAKDVYVSVIIPCRNEEKFIGICLDSILANDYPKERLEILVVDGSSEDGTREIVERYVEKYPFIRLLDNPKRIIPTAMNIGIKNTKGAIIMKIDAHSLYEKDYISKCISFLNKYDADNVGGLQVAIPRNNTIVGKAIVFSLSHPFGVGNSHHRLRPEKPLWADTAYSGCYRREVFDRIGLYDENIARSEDVNINSRLREVGGKILLVPEIVGYYYARSKFSEFCKHNFDNGFWINYPLKYGRKLFSWRHLIPLSFTVSLISAATLSVLSPIFFKLLVFILGMYFLINIYFSCKISIKEKNLVYLVIMPIVFASLHIGYGLGSLAGLARVVSSKLFLVKRTEGRRRPCS